MFSWTGGSTGRGWGVGVGGVARRGSSWHDAGHHGTTQVIMARHSSSRCDTPRHDLLGFNRAWHGAARLNTARHGSTWLVMVQHVLSWRNMPWHRPTQLIMAQHALARLVMTQHGLA
ncbi:hypothetical protein LUU34_01610700 [Aix galericulata]|nr:hypothetical protein LUU34_01610700 [Aix galericulata]